MGIKLNLRVNLKVTELSLVRGGPGTHNNSAFVEVCGTLILNVYEEADKTS